MSTTSANLTVRGINVDVVYKDIKNLHIGVYPPLGRVRVAAPVRLREDQIRLAVVQRLPWIKRKRDQMINAARQSQREFVSGESHYVWGARYRLKVVERPGPRHIELDSGRLVMYIPNELEPARREALLQGWYRDQLRSALSPMLERWESRVGCRPSAWGIRRMRTRWGTCVQKSGRLTFNLELAKKDPLCVEYIVVHELAHLRVRGHGAAFVSLMNELMPDWRSRRDLLAVAPLSSELWHGEDHRPQGNRERHGAYEEALPLSVKS